MDFDIKKGHYGELEGNGLLQIAETIFGKASLEGDLVVATFGAIERLEAKIVGKTVLSVVTKMRTDVSSEEANDTIKRFNTFLERATGFNSKERRTRLQKKAKDGKL
jgi:hypothetical protein